MGGVMAPANTRLPAQSHGDCRVSAHLVAFAVDLLAALISYQT